MRGVTRENVELAVKVFGLAGVILAVVSFFVDQERSRQELLRIRSDEYSAVYARDTMSKAQLIDISLIPFTGTFGPDAFSKGSEVPTDAEVQLVFSGVFLGRFGDGVENPLLDELLSVLNFFNRAHTCLEEELCDRRVLLALLCEHVISFDRLAHRFVALYERDYGRVGVGNGLAGLVEECR